MRTIHPRLRAATFVVPLFCVASAACDIAMADLKEKETAEWRKTYELQPGGRLEIGNVNGKIDVRPGTGNTVEVVAEKIAQGATKEAAREALGRVEITEDASPSLVKVETKLHKGTAGIFGGVNVQVQYSVRVPSNIEVHVSTVNGGIDISGVTGRVLAEATNGGIRGREIAGPIDASTTNGGVDVELTKVAASGVKLETTNGGIKLRLPTDAKASISARIVNGGIDTEGFSIQGTGENSRRRLDGDLNGGGPRIQLEGTNGGISIRPR